MSILLLSLLLMFFVAIGIILPLRNREMFTNPSVSLEPSVLSNKSIASEINIRTPVNINFLSRELSQFGLSEGFDNLKTNPNVPPYNGPLKISDMSLPDPSKNTFQVTNTSTVGNDMVYIAQDMNNNVLMVKLHKFYNGLSFEPRSFPGEIKEFDPSNWTSYVSAPQLTININPESNIINNITPLYLTPFNGSATITNTETNETVPVKYTAILNGDTVILAPSLKVLSNAVYMIRIRVNSIDPRILSGNVSLFNPANWDTYKFANLTLNPNQIPNGFNPAINPLNPAINPLNPAINPLNPAGCPLNPAINPLNPAVNPLNPAINPLNPAGCPTCPCPDMSQYININEIPCWNCTLP